MSLSRTSRWCKVWLICAGVFFVLNLGNALMFAFYTSASDRRVGMMFFVLLVPLFALFVILAGISAGARIVTAEDVPCPSCGYNLRGLREARCPECGSSFTIEQLVGLTKHCTGPGPERSS